MYKGILEIFGYRKWRFLEGFKVLMVVVQKCDVCTCRDNCWQSVNFFIKKKNMYRFKKLQ